MARAAEIQQPTAPPPKEEGPRSFSVFFQKLAAGEAEQVCSTELFELGKRMQEQAAARGEPVKGSLTVVLNFEADPDNSGVTATYEVKSKPPLPRRAKGFFWLTPGGNLTTEVPKTRQTSLPFGDVANARGIPNDLDDEELELED